MDVRYASWSWLALLENMACLMVLKGSIPCTKVYEMATTQTILCMQILRQVTKPDITLHYWCGKHSRLPGSGGRGRELGAALWGIWSPWWSKPTSHINTWLIQLHTLLYTHTKYQRNLPGKQSADSCHDWVQNYVASSCSVCCLPHAPLLVSIIQGLQAWAPKLPEKLENMNWKISCTAYHHGLTMYKVFIFLACSWPAM